MASQPVGDTIYRLPDDQFVVWSSVSGGPTVWGSGEEVTAKLIKWEQARIEEAVAARFVRVDAWGTSSQLGRAEDELMYGQMGTIKMEDVPRFLATFNKNATSMDDEFDTSMLEPLDWGDPDPDEDEPDSAPASGMPRAQNEPWHSRLTQ